MLVMKVVFISQYVLLKPKAQTKQYHCFIISKYHIGCHIIHYFGNNYDGLQIYHGMSEMSNKSPVHFDTLTKCSTPSVCL